MRKPSFEEIISDPDTKLYPQSSKQQKGMILFI